MCTNPVTQNPKGVWGCAEAYDVYMGKWSIEIARCFVQSLAMSRNARWLDVGCGTGAVSTAIAALAEPSAIVAVDRSPAFVEFAKARLKHVAIEFMQSDVAALDLASESFDAAVAGLVLNFLPDPIGAVREMARTVKPGGTVAAYVWDYGGRMGILRPVLDAAIGLDPNAVRADEAACSHSWRPDTLLGAFAAVGLERCRCEPIEIEAVFPTFRDYWTPFLGGQGMVGSYLASLSDTLRTRLCQTVAVRLPTREDGSITVGVRAWAFSGLRPARGRP